DDHRLPGLDRADRLFLEGIEGKGVPRRKSAVDIHTFIVSFAANASGGKVARMTNARGYPGPVTSKEFAREGTGSVGPPAAAWAGRLAAAERGAGAPSGADL